MQPKYIKLSGTREKYAIVDADVFDYLNTWKWHYGKKDGYARRGTKIKGKSKTYLIHRLIIDIPIGMQIDHINGNRLDNRRENLRVCTPKQNARNRSLQANSSGYKGVNWDKQMKKWRSKIKIDGKQIFLGLFDNKLDAAKAYDKSAIELFGEFAHPNLERRLSN